MEPPTGPTAVVAHFQSLAYDREVCLCMAKWDAYRIAIIAIIAILPMRANVARIFSASLQQRKCNRASKSIRFE